MKTKFTATEAIKNGNPNQLYEGQPLIFHAIDQQDEELIDILFNDEKLDINAKIKKNISGYQRVSESPSSYEAKHGSYEESSLFAYCLSQNRKDLALKLIEKNVKLDITHKTVQIIYEQNPYSYPKNEKKTFN